MKQIIFIAAIVFSVGVMALAQTNDCKKQPELITEYSNSSVGSQKNTVQNFRDTFVESPKCRAVIRIQSKNNSEVFRQFKRLYKAFLFLDFPLEQTTFAIITNSKEEKVEFWIAQPNTDLPNCEECLIIRGKDFQKLQDFFKPTTKKAKK